MQKILAFLNMYLNVRASRTRAANPSLLGGIIGEKIERIGGGVVAG
jgi:hypothetical protein